MTKKEFYIAHYSAAIRMFKELHPNHRYIRTLHSIFGFPDRRECTDQDKRVVLLEMGKFVEKLQRTSERDIEGLMDSDAPCSEVLTLLFHDREYDIVEQHNLLGGFRMITRISEESDDGSTAEMVRMIQQKRGTEWIDVGEV